MFQTLLGLLLLAAPQPWYDITAFGAKGGKQANNAAAIQRAIDACTRSGGGTVYVPPGDFLTGTIVLKDNVTLHLAPGATLWGSRQIGDYGPLHLIYAEGASNIAIEGHGAINGNGDAYWDPGFKAKEKRPSPLIELVRCRNVRIKDIRVLNTPGWGIHPLECDGVFIRGITMISDMRGPNTDGIDPDSSRNVMISDCYIETGDDAICLKTRDGNPPPPTENVTVTNCVLISDDSAIKLGTASYGDFRRCVFSNCVITGTHYGIAMYIKDGALVEGVQFSNIVIDTSVDFFNRRTGSSRQWVEYPIFLDLEQRTDESRLGRIRDVSFSDIRILTEGRVLVGSLPGRPIENLTLRNITMRVTGPEAVDTQRKPRGVARIRPAARDADYSPAPAAMIFANVRGLRLRDVRLTWDEAARAQERHAIYASRVEDLSISGFSGSPAGTKFAAIGLDGVRNAFIAGSELSAGAPLLVGLHDTPESQVSLSGNPLRPGVRATAEGAAYVHLPR
ncbi:MAG: glycoside hydrolase family 28 protein [Bryobacteraceae bacterium]